MRRMPQGAYLWPGLPQVWQLGDMRGLLAAIVAGFALSMMIVITFGWTQWLGQPMSGILWGAGIACWIAACRISSQRLRRQRLRAESPDRDLQFAAAQEHYLQGSRLETEQVLIGLLESDPRDVEARLLLATLLRRTERRSEALDHLDILERIDSAVSWRMEIARERHLSSDETDDSKDRGQYSENAEESTLTDYENGTGPESVANNPLEADESNEAA